MPYQEGYKAEYQQEILAGSETEEGYQDFYPVTLSVKGEPKVKLWLPLRPFPDGKEAIALLMTTQLNFKTLEQLSKLLAENIKDLNPYAVIGIPSLGWQLAERVAQELGHPDWVPLTTSRKFWQDADLAQPVTSVTSVQPKTLYLDSYLVSRLGKGELLVLVDDVACTGGSAAGAYQLLKKLAPKIVDPEKVYLATLLDEGKEWQSTFEKAGFDWRRRFIRTGHLPIFERSATGLWVPKQNS